MKEQLQEVSVILPYRISLDIFPLYILSLNVSLTFVEKHMQSGNLQHRSCDHWFVSQEHKYVLVHPDAELMLVLTCHFTQCFRVLWACHEGKDLSSNLATTFLCLD